MRSLTTLAVSATITGLCAADGHFLLGVSPASEALGGAAVAGNRLDMLGSVSRNPANGALFTGNRAELNLGVILPDVSVASTVSAFGLADSSDSTVTEIPYVNLGMLHRNPTAAWNWQASLVSEAGLAMEIPESTTNPAFLPQQVGGFGHVESLYQLLRLDLGGAYRSAGPWSVGMAISPSVSRFKLDPFALVAPDDANGDATFTYPENDAIATAFGVGGKLGARYQAAPWASIGACVATPTWFSDYTFDLEDELGNERTGHFRVDRPATAHLGTTLSAVTTGTDLLLEIGWLGYGNAAGFAEQGFAADGSLRGLGWSSIWTATIGVQQALGSRVTARLGGNWCQNPIAAEDTFYNVASPLHSTANYSLGIAVALPRQWSLDIAATHSPAHEQTGPLYRPGTGALPGTSITTSTEVNLLMIGLTAAW